MLQLEWALFVLSEPSQLEVYAHARTAGPLDPGVAEELREKISIRQRDHLGQWPAHQEEAAWSLLTSGSSQPLLDALVYLARHFLVWHGGAFQFKPQQILEWRERACHRVDPDILMLTAAALEVELDSPNPPARRMDDQIADFITCAPFIPAVALPTLERLRDAGLVEIHRHLGLTCLPPLVWEQALSRDDLDEQIRSPAPLGYSWHQLLRHARKLRSVLVDFALEQFDGKADDWEHRALLSLSPPHKVDQARDERALTSTTDHAAWLPGARDGHSSRERALLVHTLRRLVTPEAPAWLEWVLHAYLLLRHQVLRAALQAPTRRKGLDRFKRDYVDSNWHELEDDQTLSNMLQQAWRTGGVRWLEGRVTPSKRASERIESWLHATRDPSEPLLKRVLGSDDATDRLLEEDRHRPRPALRLTIHFLKRPDDPRSVGGGPRVAFARLREELHEQALDLLEDASNPKYAPYIVGLDVASLETDTPIEVFAPTIRALRSPWPLPGFVRMGKHSERTSDFGLCIHAGEEFRHLAEGIRRVVETLDFCEYRAGDRLGHALALGVEPEAWAQRWGGVALVPKQVRLDDLVWMVEELYRLPQHAALLPVLERELRGLARQIHGRDEYNLDQLVGAWKMRAHDPLCYTWNAALPPLSPIRKHGLRSLRGALEAIDPVTEELWWRTQTDPEIASRGAEPIPVELRPDELSALRDLQDSILTRLVEQRIAIEVNPSSNLAIGPFMRVVEHPVFRWCPLSDEGSLRPTILIGSDDPGIFGAELVHEYAVLGMAAEERGATPRQVSRWLSEFHENALAFRFKGGW